MIYILEKQILEKMRKRNFSQTKYMLKVYVGCEKTPQPIYQWRFTTILCNKVYRNENLKAYFSTKSSFLGVKISKPLPELFTQTTLPRNP